MDSRAFRRRGRMASRVACGLAVLALTLSACATKTSTKGVGGLSGAQPSTTVSVSEGPTTTTTATPTATATHTTKPTHTAAAGPKIVTFDVKQKPACPVIASSDAPFSQPGTDIILEWTVTGATGVALSLDDPNFFKNNHTGSYQNYGPTDSAELSFSCDPTDQPTTTHTYTLDTLGAGKYQEKTLTVTVQTSP